MAKKKSLMDALSEYQEGNEFGRAQKKEEREKKASKNAAKAKTNTKTAFSTKQFMATDKVKPGATHRRSPSAPPPVRSSSSSGGGTSKPKSSSGSGTSKPKSDNKTSTPNRVSKFLGGQTIKQVQDAAKKREEKKKNSPYARQQADLDRLRKAQAEDRKKRKTKGRSSWAKGQLKGL